MQTAADWDAARYHRISAPHTEWGRRVLERLQPRPGERILDLGCGTGRVTRELRASAPGSLVIGLDVSGSMLAVARASAELEATDTVPYVQAAGTALPFDAAFDAVFSTATLHWIPDHRAVFSSVHASLRPGGRFVAQCGGHGNLDRLLADAECVMNASEFREYFRGWQNPWYFADACSTERQLTDAGFVDAEAWIEDTPADLCTQEAWAEFVACVCIRHHLDRLPGNRRDPFVQALSDRTLRHKDPFVLDYRRLNMTARRAPA